MTRDESFRIRDRRGGNRYFIDNDFLRKGWGKKLGPYGIAVYNALALHADANDQGAYPSYALIADMTGMSDRQVKREIAKMVEFSIIAKEPRFNSETGRQESNDYVLLHKDEWGGVTVSHGGGDSESRGGVTVSHGGGDSESPKQDSVEQNPKKQSIFDPLTHIFECSTSDSAPPAEGDPYPADQFWGHRDRFLKTFEEHFPSKKLEQVEKESIALLGAEDWADPEKWDLACRETILNFTGRKIPVQRVIDVYKAGGTWAAWIAVTYGDDDKRPVNSGAGYRPPGLTDEEIMALKNGA